MPSVAHNLPLIVMLAAAFCTRRSLGSWPVMVAAFAASVAMLLWRSVDGAFAPPLPLLLFADMMAAPILFFLLARAQVIPGLRRGQMSDAERMRWIIRNGLKDGGRPQTSLRAVAGHLHANSTARR